jgi:hypothetical protein
MVQVPSMQQWVPLLMVTPSWEAAEDRQQEAGDPRQLYFGQPGERGEYPRDG